MATQMTFDNLAQNILAVHHSARNYAKNAVNQALTIRNWLIGFYIVEYEQKGSDRAQYGTQLLKNLESKLNTKGLNNTLLKNSRLKTAENSIYFIQKLKQLSQTIKVNCWTSYCQKVRRHRTF